MISPIRSKLLFVVICAFLWSPVTASAKKTLRVMTYNIHVGVGMDKKLDLQRALHEKSSSRLLLCCTEKSALTDFSCRMFENKRESERCGMLSIEFSNPADKPVKRIDHIFYRIADRVRARKAWVVATLASDHVPVVA